MTTRTDRSVPLTAWPAADWRFLVPDHVGRVGFLGPPAPGEAAVLREAGIDVVSLDGSLDGLDAAPGGLADGPEPAAADGLDVVVVTADRPGWPAAAAGALRPGGWVLLRVGRGAEDPVWPSLRRGRGPRALLNPGGTWTGSALAAGLQVRGRFWHAPHVRRCSYVVALDQRAAVDAVLRRHHGVRFGAAKSLVARMLNRAGLTALLAGHVTVLARAGDDPASPPRVPESCSGRDAEQWFLVTPWFEASRHVVRLHLEAGSAAPATVAKLPRRPWDTGGIRHEAEVLGDLARRGDALAGRVPAVLDLRLDGRPYLLESAVVGRAVGPEVVRSERRAVLRHAADLVDALPTTGTTVQDQDWFDRLLERPLADVASAVGLPEVQPLAERTLALLEDLRGAQLPLVLEHGDLGHPNLVLGERGLGAVDWERAETYGLPGHDLCFFLQYAAEALAGTFERPGQLRAYDDAFTGPAAWARPWLRRYFLARGVEEQWWPALVLACWARSSAGLLHRLGSSAGTTADSSGTTADGPAADGLAEAFAADRDFALWRHTVARFDRLLI